MLPRDIFSHWRQVRRDLFATMARFEEHELAFAPFEGSWSVAQIMLHIADAEEGWFHHVVTGELDDWPRQFTPANYPDLAAIRGALEEVHNWTEAWLERLGEEDLARPITAPWGHTFPLQWIIWHVLEHEIHHRGELSLILGMLGREGLDV